MHDGRPECRWRCWQRGALASLLMCVCACIACSQLDRGGPDQVPAVEAPRRVQRAAAVVLDPDLRDDARDPPRVYEERRCERGDANGCLGLAPLRSDGAGGPRDRARAKQAYARACAAGNATGCNELGLLGLENQPSNDDWLAARRLFERACAGGDVKACHNAGTVWEWGQAEEQDLARARALYERACRGGIAGSCSRLSPMWKWGWGGPADRVKAAEYQTLSRSLL